MTMMMTELCHFSVCPGLRIINFSISDIHLVIFGLFDRFNYLRIYSVFVDISVAKPNLKKQQDKIVKYDFYKQIRVLG